MEMTLLKSLLEYKRARGFVWICQEFFGPLGKEPEKKRYYKYLDHLASVETYRLPATMWPFTAIEQRFALKKGEVEMMAIWMRENSVKISSVLGMDEKRFLALVDNKAWSEISARVEARRREAIR
jgi:hypothetical protein